MNIETYYGRIKPCPFCGEITYLEKKPLWQTYNGSTHGYYGCYEYDIRCHNPECGCSVKLSKSDTIYNKDEEAKQNAIESWNRRVATTDDRIHAGGLY